MLSASSAAAALQRPSPQNGRILPRVEVELDVAIRTDRAAFTGFSGNVSEGGIYVSWHAFPGPPPGRGERVEIEFTLPGAREPIAATAEVRWARRDRPHGLGAEFVAIDERSKAALEAFVAMRAALSYA
jgi:uncharacterized protein (TIGR02266 family)